MKTLLLAAVAFTALALPAFAAEGNGEPFPNNVGGFTTVMTSSQRADVGSQAYPDVAGRPGSALDVANVAIANIVPDTGNEQPVQTANSLPRGFEQGMPAYARLLPAQPTRLAGNSAYRPRS